MQWLVRILSTQVIGFIVQRIAKAFRMKLKKKQKADEVEQIKNEIIKSDTEKERADAAQALINRFNRD
jgi:phage terminase Nu1 subunit (DNA packaging protein)